MKLDFKYSIVFNGIERDRSGFGITAEMSEAEYLKLAKAIRNNESIADAVPGIITQVKEKALTLESHLTVSGEWRDKPLKKPREADSISVWLDPYDAARIKKMKDPEEELHRSEQNMTIYRSDGSFIEIRYWNGQVYIMDSLKRTTISSRTADQFIKDVTR